MGVSINNIGVVRITETGHSLLHEYVKLKDVLKNNQFFDWLQIVEELNGRFGDFFLPKGIVARNLLKVVREGEQLPSIGVYHYKFNLAIIEDDDIQEMIEEGYLVDESNLYDVSNLK